jgi:hypothetical protein
MRQPQHHLPSPETCWRRISGETRIAAGQLKESCNGKCTRTAPELPRLNEPAPDFATKTTHGMRKLSDYKGKWLILFSHPGGFHAGLHDRVHGLRQGLSGIPEAGM